ncbi:hypothetical protein Prudu_008852 [Prunus dulcis]|uniref:Uncharacterized protein n=1 Tax=Prunus dulcis TaxID=3755 RepID=A0A4Y1R566_PRUDU|nr:hypothetical protein Prudu_008852 [Prunus dulcis]
MQHTSIQLFISILAQCYMALEQMDVKTVLLHGDLEKDIYMGQPQGMGRSSCCVNDMRIMCQYMPKVQELKTFLGREFDLKDLSPAQKILGMKIRRDQEARKLWLS